MITSHVFIAVSVDGFISRVDGEIDWLEWPGSEEEDHGYNHFVSSMDAIVMGRGTFEKVLTFGEWPFDKPVVVLSGQLALTEVPENLAGRVRFFNKTPGALLEMLAQEGCRRVYLDGGKLIQSFLREGLVSDMVLTRIPTLIGTGRPLFGELDQDIRLNLVETKSFPSGLSQSRYEIQR